MVQVSALLTGLLAGTSLALALPTDLEFRQNALPAEQNGDESLLGRSPEPTVAHAFEAELLRRIAFPLAELEARQSGGGGGSAKRSEPEPTAAPVFDLQRRLAMLEARQTGGGGGSAPGGSAKRSEPTAAPALDLERRVAELEARQSGGGGGSARSEPEPTAAPVNLERRLAALEARQSGSPGGSAKRSEPEPTAAPVAQLQARQSGGGGGSAKRSEPAPTAAARAVILDHEGNPVEVKGLKARQSGSPGGSGKVQVSQAAPTGRVQLGRRGQDDENIPDGVLEALAAVPTEAHDLS